MTSTRTLGLASCVALFVALTCSGARGDNWWDQGGPSETAYRVAHKTELFQNEGIRETGTDCNWECNQSHATDWHVEEHTADVLLDGVHILDEGGTGSQEKNAETITIKYWPGVLPTVDANAAPTQGFYRSDGYIRVYCKLPPTCVAPPLRMKELWVLDVNLETQRGGGPGNNDISSDFNYGDGSGPNRTPFDYSDDDHLLVVAVNDDDDGNRVADNKQAGPITNEDNLVPVYFDFTDGISRYRMGTVSITLPSSLRLFKDAACEDEITQLTCDLHCEWDLFALNIYRKNVYVAGEQASSSLHDAVLKLKYEDPYGQSTEDQVRFTVIDVTNVAVHTTDTATHEIPSVLTDGKEHFCTAQGTGDVVLQATISPDITQCRDQITWSTTASGVTLTCPAVGRAAASGGGVRSTGTGCSPWFMGICSVTRNGVTT